MRSARRAKKSPVWPGVISCRCTSGGLDRTTTVLARSGALLIRCRLLLEQGRLARDHALRDRELALGVDVGQLEHDLRHDFLDDAAQGAGAGVALAGAAGDLVKRRGVEVKLRALHLEELLILLDQGVARLGQDA